MSLVRLCSPFLNLISSCVALGSFSFFSLRKNRCLDCLLFRRFFSLQDAGGEQEREWDLLRRVGWVPALFPGFFLFALVFFFFEEALPCGFRSLLSFFVSELEHRFYNSLTIFLSCPSSERIVLLSQRLLYWLTRKWVPYWYILLCTCIVVYPRCFSLVLLPCLIFLRLMSISISFSLSRIWSRVVTKVAMMFVIDGKDCLIRSASYALVV